MFHAAKNVIRAKVAGTCTIRDPGLDCQLQKNYSLGAPQLPPALATCFNGEPVTTTPPPHAPLHGITVADFSRVLAGPWATMTLGDLGAKVIKIERPEHGDDTRAWGPPYDNEGMATYFQSVNRNKQSIALNLKDPDDIELARRLVREADIVVDNFLPGTLDRAQLSNAEIHELNPRAIIARVSGFGSSGAGHGRPGYDFVIQALGGLMHITGERDGDPMKVGVALVDLLTARDLTIGVLAALRQRDLTGVGTLVEVNLLSSLQAALANQAQAVIGADVEPGRLGNTHPSICPYETLSCREGQLAVAIGNDPQFTKFVTELGIPHIASDSRFATNPARVKHRATLRPILEDALQAAPADEWEHRLVDLGLAVGRVATISEGIELARDVGIDPVVELERDGHTSRGIRHPVRYTPEFPIPAVGAPDLDADGDALRAYLRAQPASTQNHPTNTSN